MLKQQLKEKMTFNCSQKKGLHFENGKKGASFTREGKIG
jgi:hypothetical protein